MPLRRAGYGLVGAAALALLLAQAIVALRAAQDADAPRPQFRTTTEVFQLDVSVFDKNHVPVTGLAQEDFTVLEDGKPQPIVSFSEVAFPERDGPLYESQELAAPDVTSERLADRRLFVLLLDDFGMPCGTGGCFNATVWTNEVKRVAREFVMALGPMDFASVVLTRDLRYYPDFTNRANKLTGAIEQFRPPGEAERLILEQQARGRVGLLPALEDVLGHLVRLPQHRKTIVFIGRPPAMGVGGTGAGSDQARRLMEKAEREGVALSGIDVTLEQQIDTLSQAVAGHAFLQSLAEHTGGSFTGGREAIDAGVARILRDTQTYYLIGYQRTVEYDGRTHNLAVRVRDKTLHAFARTGYVNPNKNDVFVKGPPVLDDAEVDNAFKGLTEASDDAGLVAYAAAGDGGYRVTAELDASRAADRPWKDGADVIVTVIRGDHDQVGSATSHLNAGTRGARLDVAVPAAAGDAVSEAVKVIVTMKNGGERLERDATLVAGSKTIGPALVSRAAAAPRAPFVPAAIRRFARTERLRVEWPMRAPADSRRLRLLRRSGEALTFELPLNVSDTGGHPVLMTEFPLASLGAGDYALELTVGTGDQAERQLVAFTVTG